MDVVLYEWPQVDPEVVLPDYHFHWLFSSGKREEVTISVKREKVASSDWWFTQRRAYDELLLTLYSPADAIVGPHRLAVSLVCSATGRVLDADARTKFHLLYNPWCKGEAITHAGCQLSRLAFGLVAFDFVDQDVLHHVLRYTDER